MQNIEEQIKLNKSNLKMKSSINKNEFSSSRIYFDSIVHTNKILKVIHVNMPMRNANTLMANFSSLNSQVPANNSQHPQ